mgnify:CR=1 FL=1
MGDADAAGCPGARGRGRGGLRLPEAASSATRYSEFWRGVADRGPDNHICTPCTRCRAGSAGRRSGPWLAGFALVLPLLHPGALAAGLTARTFEPALPVPAQQVVLRRALRLACSCGPRSGSAALFWKEGDGAIIDGLGADGMAARVLWTTGRVVKLQTGYVYHYAFAMLIGVALHRHLVHVQRLGRCRRDDATTGFGVLSLVTFFPLVGALLDRRTHNGRRKAMRAGSRSTPRSFTFGVSLSSSGRTSTRPTPGFQFVEEMEWLGSSINYKMGVDGISVLFVMLTTVPDAAVHPGELGGRSRTASRNT